MIKKQKFMPSLHKMVRRSTFTGKTEGISEASAKKITQQTGNVEKITHTALGMHKINQSGK